MTRPPIPQAFELWEVTTADAGLTWSVPKNLSNTVPPLRHGEREWIVRTGGGGGNGIRIQEGKHAGTHTHVPYFNFINVNNVLFFFSVGRAGREGRGQPRSSSSSSPSSPSPLGIAAYSIFELSLTYATLCAYCARPMYI